MLSGHDDDGRLPMIPGPDEIREAMAIGLPIR
jgi:hypothetical protein